MPTIREKKHRLPKEYYKGLTTVAFTLCVKNRIPLVTDFEIFTEFEKQLVTELTDHRSDAHVYLFWQKDYYDHIIRRPEDVQKHVRYILDNPVRKGLVDDWKKYPFKGSTLHDFDEW